MANTVRVTGLKETQMAINSITVSLKTTLPSVMKMIGKLGVEDVRGKVPRFTHALAASIHYKIDEIPGRIKTEVIAGDPNIIEGSTEYPFPYGSWGEMPTDEYAEKIDLFGGKEGNGKGYMSIEAYGYLNYHAPRMVNELVQEIVSRV